MHDHVQDEDLKELTSQKPDNEGVEFGLPKSGSLHSAVAGASAPVGMTKCARRVASRG